MNNYVKNRIFNHVCTKLLKEGWEQSPINSELFYHPEFGTYQIFQAAMLQREADIKIGRRVCFTILFLLGTIYCIGYVIGQFFIFGG